MHSDLIGKIAKAQRYAQEPERIRIDKLSATFNGENGAYAISLGENHTWQCTCSFSRTWGTCAHIMAFQKIFDSMLNEEARHPDLAVSATEQGVAV